MIFGKKKKEEQKKTQQNSVGRHFIMDKKEKKKMVSSINRLIGQLETIKTDVNTDNACDQTLTQIMAVRGGVERVGRELVGKGILDCMQNYTRDELELIIKNLFKLS